MRERPGHRSCPQYRVDLSSQDLSPVQILRLPSLKQIDDEQGTQCKSVKHRLEISAWDQQREQFVKGLIDQAVQDSTPWSEIACSCTGRDEMECEGCPICREQFLAGEARYEKALQRQPSRSTPTDLENAEMPHQPGAEDEDDVIITSVSLRRNGNGHIDEVIVID